MRTYNSAIFFCAFIKTTLAGILLVVSLSASAETVESAGQEFESWSVRHPAMAGLICGLTLNQHCTKPGSDAVKGHFYRSFTGSTLAWSVAATEGAYKGWIWVGRSLLFIAAMTSTWIWCRRRLPLVSKMDQDKT